MPPSYKGAISFGLVYIPVTLSAAVKTNDIGFNMLEKKTMSRVKYKKTCVDCDNREIEQSDIVKGFQYEKDKYVIFTDEDFEKIKSKKDKNITISSFVNLNEIDPVYFDKSYYVQPTGGEKAFALLTQAMSKEGKAGIAKTVLGTRETLLLLRASNGKMFANSMYFHDEIQRAPAAIEAKTEPAELKLAASLINNMTSTFKPEEYHDEYNVKLKAAIEQKIAGKEIAVPREKKSATILNMMDALTQSLEIVKKKRA